VIRALVRSILPCVALLLVTSSVRAQATPVGGLNPGAGPAVANEGESSEAATTSSRSVKLFDGKRSVNSYVLDIGPIWARKAEDNTPGQNRQNFEHGTGEISLGSVTTTTVGAFYIAGAPRTLLRVLDSKKFSWAIFHQDLAGGIRLGPIEPEVRFGASLLSVDVFNAEWSAQLLSPRVSAGIGLHLGKIKVDIKGHAEYLWRWFGPDYFVRGITLGIRLDAPRKNMFRDDPGPR